MKRLCLFLVFALGAALCAPVAAQPADEDAPTETETGTEGDTTPDDDAEEGDSEENDPEDEGDSDDEPTEGEPEGSTSDSEVKPPEVSEEDPGDTEEDPGDTEEEPDDSGFPDNIPDDAFEPVNDISPDVLEAITLRDGFPYIDHSGMFRFRADGLYNLDLNTTGTSPILPPPSRFQPDELNPIANPDAEWYAGANIRFRYTPTLHIYEDLSITLQIDAPDNLVMGSFPNNLNAQGTGQADAPLRIYNQGQQPPQDRFGVRIKQAYGEVQTAFGLIRAGRMADQWGLGILTNDGQCMDCDYGDFSDRLMFITQPLGWYLALSYDFPAEGPVSYDDTQPLGQPMDYDQIDDVDQWSLAIFNKPLRKEERDEQARRLKELALPVLNGGIYMTYRDQEASYESHQLLDNYDNDPTAFSALEARNAEIYTTDLWLQFLWEPTKTSHLRLELELVLVLGDVGFTGVPEDSEITECFSAPDAAECEVLRRDVRQFGFAFEGEYKINRLFKVGIDFGYASGRDDFGFGVNDGINNPTDTPSNFKFDRDYSIDLLLFEELIGTVTNATYFKPWAEFEFLQQNEDVFGLRFDILYAYANEKEATPSGESGLGVELDAMLFYKEEGKFRTDLSYGLLVPLSGFDEVPGRQRVVNYPEFTSATFVSGDDEREAEVAQTVQFRMFWFY